MLCLGQRKPKLWLGSFRPKGGASKFPFTSDSMNSSGGNTAQRLAGSCAPPDLTAVTSPAPTGSVSFSVPIRIP